MSTRKELRDATARAVNSLSKAELLDNFGISRLARLDRLDTIGVPVYSSVRVLSDTVAIHAGKGFEPEAARAGAIMEAIEFHTAEQPKGKFRIAQAIQIPDEEHLPLEDCFPARSSALNEFTTVAWETAVNIQNGEPKLVPSDLVWMTSRVKDQPLMYFQMGSNGLASGATMEDAILAGLYEILERDAWTLNQFLLDNCGLMPRRTPLVSLPDQLEACVRRIESVNSRVHLFNITNDYKVPTFGAIVLDLSGGCAGTFSGYGCHLNASVAASRAVTEAAQARACYISGARDDLFRRQFLHMKRMDQAKLDQMFSELQPDRLLNEHRVMQFDDVKSELRYLLKFIRQFGVNEVYVRELGSFVDGSVHVVRVLSPQCEQVRFDHWQPGLRCLSYADRRMKAAAKQAATIKEEGEEWKNSH